MVKVSEKQFQKEMKKRLKQSGWTPVSDHRKKSVANVRAKKELVKMFNEGRVLPEVDIFTFGKTHVVAKRYRRNPSPIEIYLHSGRI